MAPVVKTDCPRSMQSHTVAFSLPALAPKAPLGLMLGGTDGKKVRQVADGSVAAEAGFREEPSGATRRASVRAATQPTRGRICGHLHALEQEVLSGTLAGSSWCEHETLAERGSERWGLERWRSAGSGGKPRKGVKDTSRQGRTVLILYCTPRVAHALGASAGVIHVVIRLSLHRYSSPRARRR